MTKHTLRFFVKEEMIEEYHLENPCIPKAGEIVFLYDEKYKVDEVVYSFDDENYALIDVELYEYEY